MSTLYVSEYAAIPFTNAYPANMVQEPPIAEQTVAIGGVSTQSNAFNGLTSIVRIHADSVCSIAFGSNPTATTAKKRLAANQTEYFFVTPQNKVAVITNS